MKGDLAVSRQRRQRSRRGARAGFTLIEALVASVILGFAITAIAAALMAGARQNSASVQYTVAVNLAQSLLDEILARPFSDPQAPSSFSLGPDTGEFARERFDNVDDYDGYAEPSGGLKSPNGTVLDDPTLTGFSRSVSAAYVYLPGQDKGGAPTFIRVEVTVEYDDRPLVTLKRLISSVEYRPVGGS